MHCDMRSGMCLGAPTLKTREEEKEQVPGISRRSSNPTSGLESHHQRALDGRLGDGCKILEGTLDDEHFLPNNNLKVLCTNVRAKS